MDKETTNIEDGGKLHCGQRNNLEPITMQPSLTNMLLDMSLCSKSQSI